MGSPRECTRILGLESFRVERVEWEGDTPDASVCVWIERRGIRGYECSGCRRRTWRVRDYKVRTWDGLPWAEHRVTLVYAQRRVRCRTCGIRTERVGFADGHARITRRLRQLIGVDCQSLPTSHAAVRHTETLRDGFEAAVRSASGRHSPYTALAVDGPEDERIVPSPPTLARFFRSRRCCIHIIGQGGAGKTRLAIEVSRWLFGQELTPHPAAVIFVDEGFDDLSVVVRDKLRSLLPDSVVSPEFAHALLSKGASA